MTNRAKKSVLLKKSFLVVCVLLLVAHLLVCSQPVNTIGDVFLKLQTFRVSASFGNDNMFDTAIVNSKSELQEFMDKNSALFDWHTCRYEGCDSSSFCPHSLKYDEDYFFDKTLIFLGAFTDRHTGVRYEIDKYDNANGALSIQVNRITKGIGGRAIVHNVLLFELSKINDLKPSDLKIEVLNDM